MRFRSVVCAFHQDVSATQLGDLLGGVSELVSTSSVFSPNNGEPVIVGAKSENFMGLPTVR